MLSGTAALILHVPLKTEAQIEDADKYFTDIIQRAGWNASPETTYTPSSYACLIFIKQKLAEKKDSGQNGTVPGHQRAKHYSTEQRTILNSTEMPTFKSFFIVSHPRHPLATPCGKLLKN
jgi:hypothetical protein